MVKKDRKAAFELLNKYLATFKVSMNFSYAEFKHFFKAN